ncbi:hypothetical protein SAMD00023353_2101440 [Rosellinia necatrix]|uniref:Uncharacterized protein n=1 Tax=Rosellinia necatrix TaxID=77044 RepID=A0A1W2TFB2_ROSNE|nr:hypothetical protein SAMD00023353_2101440 [Rosellinia necatrix]
MNTTAIVTITAEAATAGGDAGIIMSPNDLVQGILGYVLVIAFATMVLVFMACIFSNLPPTNVGAPRGGNAYELQDMNRPNNNARGNTQQQEEGQAARGFYQ